LLLLLLGTGTNNAAYDWLTNQLTARPARDDQRVNDRRKAF
jgi:hypothetical protein